MSVVYSDFDMDWKQPGEWAELSVYWRRLKQVLMDNLSEEEVLVSAFPVSHINLSASA